jgi:hypothetical protein
MVLTHRHHDGDASYDASARDAASSGVRPDHAADRRYRHRGLPHQDRHLGHRDDQRNHRRDHPDDRQSHRDHRDDQHLHRAHRDDRRTRDELHQGRRGAGYLVRDRGQRAQGAPSACHHRAAVEWGDPSGTAERHHQAVVEWGDPWAKWDGQEAAQRDEPARGHGEAGQRPREPQAQRRAPGAYRPDAVAHRPDEPQPLSPRRAH